MITLTTRRRRGRLAYRIGGSYRGRSISMTQVRFAIGRPSPATTVDGALAYPSRRLVLVHIPKTGGTSIQDFARFALHATVASHAVYQTSCNTTMIDEKNLRQFGAQSHEHCVNSYEAAHRSPREETFCVLRRVLDRAVSVFNMRWGHTDQPCDSSTLRQRLLHMLHNGDIDNFDRPQHLFASTCEHVLCFDHLHANLTTLFRSARILNGNRQVVPPTNRSLIEWAARAGSGWVNQTSGLLVLPHGQHSQRYSAHQCKTSDLDNATRRALLDRYWVDRRFLYEHCGVWEGGRESRSEDEKDARKRSRPLHEEAPPATSMLHLPSRSVMLTIYMAPSARVCSATRPQTIVSTGPRVR